jgi:putative hydrolase of the HAD superfamily
MPQIKNIIFDYGNVIFMIDFLKIQNSFTELGISNVETFFARAGQNQLFSEFETGKINSQQFRSGIRTLTNNPDLSDKTIDAIWNSLLIGIPRKNHSILLETKQKYRTFLLSNINEIHLEYIHQYLKREYQMESNDRLFEKVYYSHLIGRRKPDRDIFEYVIDDSNLNPAETLFIDDSPQHLKTAQEMGFQTHLMTKEDSLGNFMYQSGLI